MNGLCIQWGKVANSSAVPTNTTLTQGFHLSAQYTQKPTVVLSSECTLDSSSNPMSVQYTYSFSGGIGSISKTGFTCRCTNGNWIAIGY